ncbi:MAG: hypothetical protein ACFFG0_09655 [Candidatus Thorarchaeota archaeon]
MNDDNINPKIAPSVYSILEQMKKMGLTQDDLITLIQRRVKGNKKLTREQINNTLNALERIEKNFLNATDLEKWK